MTNIGKMRLLVLAILLVTFSGGSYAMTREDFDEALRQNTLYWYPAHQNTTGKGPLSCSYGFGLIGHIANLDAVTKPAYEVEATFGVEFKDPNTGRRYIPTPFWVTGFKQTLPLQLLGGFSRTRLVAIFKAKSFAEVTVARRMFAFHPNNVTCVGVFETLFNQLATQYGWTLNDQDQIAKVGRAIGNRIADIVIKKWNVDGSNNNTVDATKRGLPAIYNVMGYTTNYNLVNDPIQMYEDTDCSKIKDINDYGTHMVWNAATQSWDVASFLGPVRAADILPDFISSALYNPLIPPPRWGSNNEDKAIRGALDLVRAQEGLDDVKKSIASFWANGGTEDLQLNMLYRFIMEAIQKTPCITGIQTSWAQSLGAGVGSDAVVIQLTRKKLIRSSRTAPIVRCALAKVYPNETFNLWTEPCGGHAPLPLTKYRAFMPKTVVMAAGPESEAGHPRHCSISLTFAKLLTNTERYIGSNYTVKAGTAVTEARTATGLCSQPNTGPGTPGYSPAQDVTLSWNTWDEAIQQCADSRKYYGIHFDYSNTASVVNGKKEAAAQFKNGLSYLYGTAEGPTHSAIEF